MTDSIPVKKVNKTPEHILEAGRRYRATHRKQLNLYQRKYRAEHLDRMRQLIREGARRHYKKVKEKLKELEALKLELASLRKT